MEAAKGPTRPHNFPKKLALIAFQKNSIHTHKKKLGLMPIVKPFGVNHPRGQGFHVSIPLTLNNQRPIPIALAVSQRLCSFLLFTCFFPVIETINQFIRSPFSIWNGSWFGKPLFGLKQVKGTAGKTSLGLIWVLT